MSHTVAGLPRLLRYSLFGEGSVTDQARRRLLEQVLAPGTANGAVIVTGSVGIGKTTFLQELAAEATEAGVRVGWGVCGEFAAAPPMWGWNDAIGSVDPSFRVDTASDDNDIATGLAFRSIANWVAEAGETAPLLLILDDLHDADKSTIDLFGYLSRRPRSSKWTVIGSARPGNDDIAALRCPQINLSGLDTTATIELAAEIGVDLSTSDAEHLRRRTNGNPLFIRRLIEHRAHTTSLPPELSTLLRRELEEVPEEARPIVDALSVLGTSADRTLLTEIAASIGADMGAVESGSVLVTDGDVIAFNHALIRELMYDDLGDERRGELHSLVADVLRTRGESPLSVAHHLRRAAVAHQGRPAAAMATEAGDLALGMGALPEALEHYSLAVSILDRVGSPDECANGMLRRARAQSFAGQVEAAAETIDDAAALGTADDTLSPAVKRAILREYGRLRWREEPNLTTLNGKWLIDRVDAWLPAPDDPIDVAVRSIAVVAAGEIDGFRPDHLDAAEIAVEAAHLADDPALIGESLLGRRRALMVHPGTFDRRETDSLAALDAARDADDNEMTVRAQRMVVADALVAGDRPTALGIIGAIENVPTAGLREHEALWRAGIATIEGRYDDAEEILTEASKELAYLGIEAPSLEFVRVIFALDDGTLSTSLEKYEPLIAVVADPVLQAAFALAAATDGDTDRANALLDEAIPSLLADDATLLWPMAMAMCVEAAAAVDRPECAALLAAVEPFSGYCMTPNAAAVPWLGAYDRLIGLLRLRTGDFDGAVTALDASLRTHQRLRAKPWAARSHAALAFALGALERHEQATEHGRAAGDIAKELQMGPVLLVGDYDATRATAAAPSNDATTSTEAAGPRRGTFRRSGTGWEVSFGGDTRHVGNLAGMRFLHVLLSSPGNDWHVLDLYGAASAGATVIEGSSGAVLDDTARRQYQDRYRDLSIQLEEAEQRSDIGRVEQMQSELDSLEQELLAAFGLGGRSRQLDDPSERARINVRRSISRAMDTIAKTDPVMADHLRHRVTTGRFCRYGPDATNPVEWNVLSG